MNDNESLDLRQVMRHWATGVTVVTSFDGQRRHGMTVSSFTSVSLTPPWVLVSIQRDSQTHQVILQSKVFGITVLSINQMAVSDCFAGRDDCEYTDRFAGLETFSLATGSPFIIGGLAFMDCRLVNTSDAGTNTLFIGEVIAVRAGSDDPPLLYYDRGYRRLSE